jgi:hypothetical protein
MEYDFIHQLLQQKHITAAKKLEYQLKKYYQANTIRHSLATLNVNG